MVRKELVGSGNHEALRNLCYEFIECEGLEVESLGCPSMPTAYKWAPPGATTIGLFALTNRFVLQLQTLQIGLNSRIIIIIISIKEHPATHTAQATKSPELHVSFFCLGRPRQISQRGEELVLLLDPGDRLLHTSPWARQTKKETSKSLALSGLEWLLHSAAAGPGSPCSPSTPVPRQDKNLPYDGPAP
jgi:hypothetical protein